MEHQPSSGRERLGGDGGQAPHRHGQTFHRRAAERAGRDVRAAGQGRADPYLLQHRGASYRDAGRQRGDGGPHQPHHGGPSVSFHHASNRRAQAGGADGAAPAAAAAPVHAGGRAGPAHHPRAAGRGFAFSQRLEAAGAVAPGPPAGRHQHRSWCTTCGGTIDITLLEVQSTSNCASRCGDPRRPL